MSIHLSSILMCFTKQECSIYKQLTIELKHYYIYTFNTCRHYKTFLVNEYEQWSVYNWDALKVTLALLQKCLHEVGTSIIPR